MMATRSGTASMACSARSAMFRATEPKLERVTFSFKSVALMQEGDRSVSDIKSTEKGPDALIEQRGHTLILTLNRPEARNALSTEMLSIMVEAWDRVDNDPEITSCILTGAGGDFLPGLDPKAATAQPPGDSVHDLGSHPSPPPPLPHGPPPPPPPIP